MKFFSKELSGKLREIGCVSISYYPNWITKGQDPVDTGVFSIGDFLSDEPYALENCKKVFGSHVKSKHEFVIYLLLVAPDQEAFLWEALGGKGEK